MLLSEELSQILKTVPEDVKGTDDIDSVDYSDLRVSLSVAIQSATEFEDKSDKLTKELEDRTEKKITMTATYTKVRNNITETALRRNETKPDKQQTDVDNFDSRLNKTKNLLQGLSVKQK